MEYAPSEMTEEQHSIDIKVFGRSYQIDRVIASMSGIVSEVELQQFRKIKAAQALLNNAFINGDEAIDTNAFGGLDKALAGSTTEYNTGDTMIDFFTSQLVTDNSQYLPDMLDEFLRDLDSEPSLITGNTELISKLQACARRAAMYQVAGSDQGISAESYGDIPFVDLGTKPGTNDDVVRTDTTRGATSLYVTRLSVDGSYSISFAGMAPVQIWLPNSTTVGAVRIGEVEVNVTITSEVSKAVGVLRNTKVK